MIRALRARQNYNSLPSRPNGRSLRENYLAGDFFLHFPAPVEIQRHFWFEKNQFYVIVLTSALEKGHQYKIKMKFRAELGDGLAGLYKSTYTREDGTEVYVNFINPSTFF